MTIAYLNGDFIPLTEARISPMDRGFLFGDGVYEVIPSYQGQFVALDYHLERLRNSLEGIHLTINQSNEQLANCADKRAAVIKGCTFKSHGGW
jgi:D-alanine transaminase